MTRLLRWVGMAAAVVAGVAAPVVASGDPTTTSDEVVHTAPFSHGCVGAPPCAHDNEPGREGVIRTMARVPLVSRTGCQIIPCVPVAVSWGHLSTTAGIDVMPAGSGTTWVTATVHLVDVPHAPRSTVCLHLAPAGEETVAGGGLSPLCPTWIQSGASLASGDTHVLQNHSTSTAPLVAWVDVRSVSPTATVVVDQFTHFSRP